MFCCFYRNSTTELKYPICNFCLFFYSFPDFFQSFLFFTVLCKNELRFHFTCQIFLTDQYFSSSIDIVLHSQKGWGSLKLMRLTKTFKSHNGRTWHERICQFLYELLALRCQVSFSNLNLTAMIKLHYFLLGFVTPLFHFTPSQTGWFLVSLSSFHILQYLLLFFCFQVVLFLQ